MECSEFCRIAIVILWTKLQCIAFTIYPKWCANTVLELCGYILVKGSPSSGYGRVKRYSPEGHHLASEQNAVFACALANANPLLPLEDDGRLNDPGLRRRISDEQRQRLSLLIEDYRTGNAPLIVPLTMLKHHFADHPNAYINGQVFLDPYPAKLPVRNVV